MKKITVRYATGLHFDAIVEYRFGGQKPEPVSGATWDVSVDYPIVTARLWLPCGGHGSLLDSLIDRDARVFGSSLVPCWGRNSNWENMPPYMPGSATARYVGAGDGSPSSVPYNFREREFACADVYSAFSDARASVAEDIAALRRVTMARAARLSERLNIRHSAITAWHQICDDWESERESVVAGESV